MTSLWNYLSCFNIPSSIRVEGMKEVFDFPGYQMVQQMIFPSNKGWNYEFNLKFN